VKFLLAIIIFFCKPIYSQYYAKWDSKPLELGVSNYVLQDSAKGSKWSNIATVQPVKLSDTNHYQVQVPLQNGYYRLISYYIDGAIRYSQVLYLSSNNVLVTNASYNRQSWLDVISWTVNNSNNIYFYRIDQTTDGKKYSVVVNYRNGGNKNYKYSIYRKSGIKPTYRITPVFNDLSLGTSILFK